MGKINVIPPSKSDFGNKRYTVVPLEKNQNSESQKHDRYVECFDCGNSFLNNKLREIFKKETLGCLYGMIDTIDEKLIGYYSISTSYIIDNPFFKLKETYYGDQGFFVGRPTLNLQYFAIDNEFQGKYIDEDQKFKFSQILAENCVKELKGISNLVKLKDVTVYSTVQALGMYFDLGFNFLDSEDRDNYIEYRKREKASSFKLKTKKLSEYRRIFCGHKSDSDCFPMLGNVDSLEFMYDE